MEIDNFLNRIPGCACDVGNDGALEAEKAVEEGGFPDIWLAENHRPDSFSDNATLVCSGEEGIDDFQDAENT